VLRWWRSDAGVPGRGRGVNEAEVMAKAVEHAKKDHGMTTIPPDVAAKAKAAIKDK
jgi:predicted small metal-binding protein